MNDKLRRSLEALKGRSYTLRRLKEDSPFAEAIDTVVSHCEQKTYTPADMEAFAEWCSENGWNISIKKHRWVNDNGEGINTAQLREQWEYWKAKQRGEATE